MMTNKAATVPTAGKKAPEKMTIVAPVVTDAQMKEWREEAWKNCPHPKAHNRKRQEYVENYVLRKVQSKKPVEREYKGNTKVVTSIKINQGTKEWPHIIEGYGIDTVNRKTAQMFMRDKDTVCAQRSVIGVIKPEPKKKAKLNKSVGKPKSGIRKK